MKPSSAVMSETKRQSLNHPQVRRDFPIGHAVLINGIKAFVIGYVHAPLRDQAMLWITVKHPNEDYFNCDPYIWNLNKVDDSSEEEGQEEVEAEATTDEAQA